MTGRTITTQHRMAWYQFSVYFHLFAFAVLYVIQGMMHLQGLVDGFGTAEELYVRYPTLKQIEVIMAVLGFGIAILSIVARQLLWYFHAWGPRVYLWVMILSGLYSSIYHGLASLVVGLPIFTYYDIGGAISTVVIAILCRNYYETRKDLFQPET